MALYLLTPSALARISSLYISVCFDWLDCIRQGLIVIFDSGVKLSVLLPFYPLFVLNRIRYVCIVECRSREDILDNKAIVWRTFEHFVILEHFKEIVVQAIEDSKVCEDQDVNVIQKLLVSWYSASHVIIREHATYKSLHYTGTAEETRRAYN